MEIVTDDFSIPVQSCVRFGNFELHSGEKSTWICDLLLIRHLLPAFCYHLKPKHQVVGIELGGMLLAGLEAGFIRKDMTYYSVRRNLPLVVSLIDDVVTTEISMLKACMALEELGIEVGEYLCVLDRREPDCRTLEVRSLVTADQLDLTPI